MTGHPFTFTERERSQAFSGVRQACVPYGIIRERLFA